MNNNSIVKKDVWSSLKQHTDARIALGRTGNALPTHELLKFGMSHALAKDVIYKELEVEKIQNFLSENHFDSYIVNSKATNRKDYLMNPNLGRQLAEDSTNDLKNKNIEKKNITIIFADGLSATAINTNACPLLMEIQTALIPTSFKLSPIIIAQQARVAISDEIGEVLQSQASIIFIGERPGLSSPDSLGIYLTWNPKKGKKESERNCISNVRTQGLSYKEAAFKTIWLLSEAKKINTSGILLKDESPSLELKETKNVTLPHSKTISLS